MSDLFSYRYGYKEVRSKIQIESIDEDLVNSLWNLLCDFYWDKNTKNYLEPGTAIAYLIQRIWSEYFKKRKDTISSSWSRIYGELRDYFYGCDWNEVYDFMQYIANNYSYEKTNENFMDECNRILKRELAGYRFVGGKIAQITAEEEIAEIEEALKVSQPSGTVVHLETALEMLSDRKSPDYRNSIKESISAVETICATITDNPKATLGVALGQIRRQGKVSIHPALNEAFDHLYGWTSADDGIRHKLMEEADSDFEDAKFMLVACSAFVNYLKVKASKAGIRFES